MARWSKKPFGTGVLDAKPKELSLILRTHTPNTHRDTCVTQSKPQSLQTGLDGLPPPRSLSLLYWALLTIL